MEEHLMIIVISFLSMLMLIFELVMKRIKENNKIYRYKIQSTMLKILLFVLLITLFGFTAISFSIIDTMILISCYLIIFLWSFEVW